MKKILSLVLALAMLAGIIALASCGETPVVTDPEQTTAATQGTTATTVPEETTQATTAGDDGPVVPIEASKESIKILAIGNSFSSDATEHLYGILKDLGAKEVVLGNMYISGCSLATHAANITSDSASYEFHFNKTGKWSTQKNQKLSYALSYAKWDYIIIQQVSGLSGVADSYEPYLTTLVDAIKEKCPDATLGFHMTWAYQNGANHSDFPKYDNDQMTMYNAITAAVQANVLPHEEIKIIIPSGTAIQNLRTSYVGDNVTRDGYHLSYGEGRYQAAVTWAKAITNWDMSGLKWSPENYKLTETKIACIVDAAENAVKTPFEVTPSTFTIKTNLLEILNKFKIDINNYNELELGLEHYAYYNSTDSSKYGRAISRAAGDTANNLVQFTATKIFEKDELPEGTLILIADGFQYRPEGWINLETKNAGSARPANVTKEIVMVDDEWWGSWNLRAFNLANVGNPNLDDAKQQILEDVFMILVPKSPDVPKPDLNIDVVEKTVDDYFKEAGYNPADYMKLHLDITNYAYYNSTQNSVLNSKANSTASNLNQFAATQIIDKALIPNGSVVVVMTGYQYRPEGWTDLQTKNASSARPANVTAVATVVDDAWWGTFEYRAFNIAKSGNPGLSDEEMLKLKDVFAIYVPKTELKAETPDEFMTLLGYKLKDFEKLELEITDYAYYNSTSSSKIVSRANSNASNLNQFAATVIFERSDIPNGSIIVVMDGYQYRPEGWVDLQTKNASSERPANVTEKIIVVTNEWWGPFNYRAFNVAKAGNPALNDEGMASLHEMFVVYKYDVGPVD